MTYRAPVRDQAFILRDVLNLAAYANLPGFENADIDTVDQILHLGDGLVVLHEFSHGLTAAL